MIVTHTTTANGQCRVYLGSKSSLEFWIQPKDDKRGWTFHLDAAVTGTQLTTEDHRDAAIDILSKLANELAVAPADLATVPFEAVAALHTTAPCGSRRIPSSKRRAPNQGYISTPPGITRPRSDFTAADWTGKAQRKR